MTIQFDLFTEQENETREQQRRKQWKSIWDWEGSEIGGYCETENICADMESGGSIYCYMETIRLIKKLPSGSWIGEIAMGIVHGHPWGKDGTRVILAESNISAPSRRLNELEETDALSGV